MKIVFIGDIMLGRYDESESITTFQTILDTHKKELLYTNVLPILQSADILIGNLETAITDKTGRLPKTFNFRLSPRYVDFLKLNGNVCYNLANNHCLDYGYDGLYDTMDVLKNNGINYVGVGKNIYDASKPMVYEKNGYKVGIIGCSDQPDRSWAATKTKPGLFFLGDINMEYIREIKSLVNLLIVSIHWGPNWVNDTAIFDKTRDIFFSYGVDIIHGHSSHSILPIYKDERHLCIYGNGDFIDDYAIDEKFRNDYGMIVEYNVEKINVYKTQIKDKSVSLV